MREQGVRRFGVRALLTTLWLALLLAQTSALMHRMVHGAHAGLASQATVQATEAASSHAGLARLWGEHARSLDCQSLDQLAHATPLSCVVLPVVSQPMQAQAPSVLASVFVRPLRPYFAQAPPLSV